MALLFPRRKTDFLTINDANCDHRVAITSDLAVGVVACVFEIAPLFLGPVTVMRTTAGLAATTVICGCVSISDVMALWYRGVALYLSDFAHHPADPYIMVDIIRSEFACLLCRTKSITCVYYLLLVQHISVAKKK